ncbi:intraflagellar transport protein 43 homolog A isoform X1 [Nematostella vectensis]|uniref:intraflagellar transport protein 43 homolog A isoform X1 n=2 Tax=Nematostella vectensis TaxID=45351 RepID=UPI00138FE4BC|nr:intraflagellar transport protein 43 homolog A isoform X1 [Nematostella vectensis]
MTFQLREKVTGKQQLSEWTQVLANINLPGNLKLQQGQEFEMAKEIRQGRRAGNLAAQSNNNNEGDDDLLDGDFGETSAPPPDDMPPRPSRRQGGWADDTPKEKKKGGGGDVEAFDDDERLRVENDKPKDEDNDILVIPDLEEVQEEDMATQIAAPPSVQVNRVATYKELDSYYQKHSALFSLDGDIDLKLLSNVLSPESEVFEEDKAWDWNRLFTEIASELQTEWDKADEKSEESEKT